MKAYTGYRFKRGLYGGFVALCCAWSGGAFATCDEIKEGLVGCYSFDGNANDGSGNANHGTVNGATLTTDRFGKANSAYLFNGTNSFIEVKDNTALRLANTDFTLGVWVYETARNSSYADALLIKRGRGNRDGWGYSVANNGLVGYGVSGGGDPAAYSVTLLPLNSWHHVLMTYNKTLQQVRIYRDGVLDSQTNGIPSPNPNTVSNLFIGKDSANAYNGYYFHGMMDDVQIYNRALTAAEIQQLAEIQPPKCDGITTGLVLCLSGGENAWDGSGNGNNGLIQGVVPTQDRVGSPNGAYKFDSGAYIQVPNSPSLNIAGNITVSAWIRSSSTPQHTGLFHKKTLDYSGNRVTGWQAVINSYGANNLRMSVWNSWPSAGGSTPSLTKVVDGNWHHLVGVYDGQTITVYTDGIKDNTVPYTEGMLPNDRPLYIGVDPDVWGSAYWGSRNFQGDIDNVRIYNRALSDAEVQQLAGVTPTKVTLTVTKPANGTLTGNGINCGTDCTEDLAPNTAVTLTATPDSGYVFKNWTGDCTGTTPTTTVTLDKAKSCAATFELATVVPPPPGEPGNLSLQKLGNGSGTIKATSPKDTLNCDLACQKTSYQYPAGAKVKLSAKPYNAGVQFTGWGGNCSGSEPIITVTLEQAKACTATFALIPKDQLPAGIYNFLFSTGGTGKGVIKSNLGTINCGDKCEGNYVEGLKLVVTAEPSPLSTFVKWSDGCGVKDPTNPRASILADSHKTCSAEFTSATETAANSLVDTLYQDPTVETQFPRALNEACMNEAFWLATTPMAFVDNHLKVVGDWPVQFNGLSWYNQSPVGTCTQSVKVNSDAHGDYIEVKVNLQTAAGATEAAGIIVSVEDLSAQTNWGYTPIYLPWVQM